MQNIIVVMILLLVNCTGYSQAAGFDVFGVQTNPTKGPYSILTLDTLEKVVTLRDLYSRYHESWVASYRNVEITSVCEGIGNLAVSKNDTLTFEQLTLLRNADSDCRIDVVIDYIPQNNLKDNPPRKYNFSLTVVPVMEAKFPGGIPELRNYLRKHIVDKVSKSTFEKIHLAAIKFNINEQGQVDRAHIFKSSNHEDVDAMMLQVIRHLPTWSPAENSTGNKVPQEFEFRMGTSMTMCNYSY
jgi:TonB family protein